MQLPDLPWRTASEFPAAAPAGLERERRELLPGLELWSAVRQ